MYVTLPGTVVGVLTPCTATETSSDSEVVPASPYGIKKEDLNAIEAFMQFHSTKHHRFSLGTPVSSCGSTGSRRDG